MWACCLFKDSNKHFQICLSFSLLSLLTSVGWSTNSLWQTLVLRGCTPPPTPPTWVPPSTSPPWASSSGSRKITSRRERWSSEYFWCFNWLQLVPNQWCHSIFSFQIHWTSPVPVDQAWLFSPQTVILPSHVGGQLTLLLIGWSKWWLVQLQCFSSVEAYSDKNIHILSGSSEKNCWSCIRLWLTWYESE